MIILNLNGKKFVGKGIKTIIRRQYSSRYLDGSNKTILIGSTYNISLSKDECIPLYETSPLQVEECNPDWLPDNLKIRLSLNSRGNIDPGVNAGRPDILCVITDDDPRKITMKSNQIS